MTVPSIGLRTGGTVPLADTGTQVPVGGPMSVKSPPAKSPRGVDASAKTVPSVTQARDGSSDRAGRALAGLGAPNVARATVSTIAAATRLPSALTLNFLPPHLEFRRLVSTVTPK